MAEVNSTPGVNSLESIQETHEKFKDLYTKGKGDLTKNDFYKLLTAEMANQDPLEPMSNTEFISQMASFSALQAQQDALYFANANYAQALVGKYAIMASDAGGGLDVKEGLVSGVDFSGGEFTLTVGGKQFSLRNLMEVVDPNAGKANSTDIANASALIGKMVTVSVMKNGKGVVEEGVVDRIEVKDGVVSVIINKIAYPLDSVAIIKDYVKPVETEEGEEEYTGVADPDGTDPIDGDGDGTTPIDGDGDGDGTTPIDGDGDGDGTTPIGGGGDGTGSSGDSTGLNNGMYNELNNMFS